MLVLMLPRVSSRVSGFPVASPCLWGKLQNLSFWQAVMSICVAGAALCDIPTCLITRRKPCGRRKTFALLSQDELQFSWQAQHFGDLCRNFAWQAQHSTLHTPPFTLHTPPLCPVNRDLQAGEPLRAWHVYQGGHCGQHGAEKFGTSNRYIWRFPKSWGVPPNHEQTCWKLPGYLAYKWPACEIYGCGDLTICQKAHIDLQLGDTVVLDGPIMLNAEYLPSMPFQFFNSGRISMRAPRSNCLQ